MSSAATLFSLHLLEDSTTQTANGSFRKRVVTSDSWGHWKRHVEECTSVPHPTETREQCARYFQFFNTTLRWGHQSVLVWKQTTGRKMKTETETAAVGVHTTSP